jgi:excisionase family DNA binding protein
MEKEILTLEEAAELLEISPRALREATARGEVPGRKVANRWRFSRFALHRWLSGPEPEKIHPYLRHAGALAGNPLWEEVQEAIAQARQAQRPKPRGRAEKAKQR